MSYLDSFLHPEDAYGDAQEQMDKYFQMALGFQQPYMARGDAAYAELAPALARLMNPEQLQSDWIEGYEESPYARNTADIAQQEGLDAMSSMGLMGSSPGLNAMQKGTSQIMLNDRGNYLDELMKKYMTGINLGNNIYNTGANAANTAGQYAMTMGDSSATNAANKQSAPGRMMGNLLGTGATLGATALGGPQAGMMMNKMNPWSTTGNMKSVGNKPVIPNPFAGY